MKARIKFLIMTSITAVLFFSVSAHAADSGACGNNLTWVLDDSGVLTISGTGKMDNWSSSSMPWYSSKDNIKSVIISENVTSVGNYAFYDHAYLESVTLPSSITSVGGYTFKKCDSLTRVNIADVSSWCNINFLSPTSNPLYYSEKLYLNNELITDLVIPDNVTSVGKYAFYACTALESVTIPDSVTSIKNAAFHLCENLTDVYYAGDEEAWKEITISGNNIELTNAAIHYNYDTNDNNVSISFNTSDGKITISSDKAVSSAVLIAAIYNENKLIDAETKDISLVTGENTIVNPITDYSAADAMKICIWNSLEEMVPLGNCCKTELIDEESSENERSINNEKELIYSGALSNYDNEAWANIDFSTDTVLVIFNWDNGDVIYVVPDENQVDTARIYTMD